MSFAREDASDLSQDEEVWVSVVLGEQVRGGAGSAGADESEEEEEDDVVAGPAE